MASWRKTLFSLTCIIMLLTSHHGVAQKNQFFEIFPKTSFILGSDGWDYLTTNVIDSKGNLYLSGYFIYPVYGSNYNTPANLYDGPYYDLDRNDFKEYPVIGENQSVHYSGRNEVPVTKFNENYEIEYSAYFGGNGSETAKGIVTRENGNILIFGDSTSQSFFSPIFNITNRGYQDGYIIELDENGQHLSSMSIGGSGFDQIIDVCIGKDGSIYILGTSSSYDFPLINAYDDFLGQNNETDVFLTKLSPDYHIEFSTFLGGSAVDYATGIDLDSDENIYITGFTFSPDFPTYATFDLFEGRTDGFIAKFDRNGTIQVARYLGGEQRDVINDISISNDTILIGGQTNSVHFKIIHDGTTDIDSMINSDGSTYTTTDGFYAFLNLDLAILNSAYLGGSYSDLVNWVYLDENGNGILVGRTNSADFPIYGDFPRPPLFNQLVVTDPAEAVNKYDLFITKINPVGELMYSIYYGGFLDDSVYQASIRKSGSTTSVIMSSYSTSVDLPVTHQFVGAIELLNSFVLEFEIPEGKFDRVDFPELQEAFPWSLVALTGVALLLVATLVIIRLRKGAKRRIEQENYMERHSLFREAMKEE